MTDQAAVVPWAEVAVDIAAEAEEAVANRLIEIGAPGIVSESRGGGGRRVLAYYPDDARLADRLVRIRAALGSLAAWGLPPTPAAIAVRRLSSTDWANAWKAHYHPLAIGPFWIVPSWEKRPPEGGRYVIELDPGMAFGTGYHPTTALCLEALAKQVQPGDRVWDVGTGSGILAIAAAKLGAVVWATDVDPVAVAIARANVQANGGAAQVQVLEGSLDALEARQAAEAAPTPQIVVMNILAEIVSELAPQAARTLAAGGLLIASGIACEKETAVQAALQATGFGQLEAPRRRDGWTLLEARR